VSYTDKGTPYQESFSIPAGEYERISVYAYPGKTINGNFQVSGGSGNDVNFFITTIDCKQNVKFSFTLFNSGHVDGNVIVKLLADNQQFWSNNYIVEVEEKVTKNSSVLIPNCNEDLEIIISEQKSANYFGSFLE